MEPQFTEQQILIDLGLTPKQAKVYLALTKFGPSKINEISKNSRIIRTDIYSTLEKLQQLTLVEKIVEAPLKYTAIPLKEGLSLLLETKTEQYKRVKVETEILVDSIKPSEPNDAKRTESQQFILIPEGRTIVNRIGAAIENAQQSIEVVVSWKRFSSGLINAFVESIEAAWAKNVKIRAIVERPRKTKTEEQIISYFRKKPGSQIRFIPYNPTTIFGIYDRKELLVIIISEKDLQDSPALWSSSDALISLAKNYFEVLWREATENI